MPNIYLNLQPTYLNKQTCIFFVSHTGLLFHKDLFSAAANTSEPPTRTFSFHWHSPNRYVIHTDDTDDSVPDAANTGQLVHNGHFLSNEIAHTGTSGGYSLFPSTQVSLLSTRTSTGSSTSYPTQGSFLSTRTSGAPWLPSPHRANFCRQGNMKSTWFPSPQGPIPVRKNIWRLHSFFYKNNFIRTRASYLTKS